MRGKPKAGSLLLFAPIREGHGQRLRTMLERLGDGGESPLAKVGKTHVARFVVLDHLLEGRGGEPLDSDAYLLFGSEFDGSADAYLDALTGLPEAMEIWSHCRDFERGGGRPALRRYLEDHRVLPGSSVAAYETASLDEVRQSLRLRDRLIAFVVASRELDPVTLRRAWFDAFPEAR